MIGKIYWIKLKRTMRGPNEVNPNTREVGNMIQKIKQLFCKHSPGFDVFVSYDAKSDLELFIITVRCTWCEAIISQNYRTQPLAYKTLTDLKPLIGEE